MRDYYDKFITICIRRCATSNDLLDKNKLKLHNKAMDQLEELQKNMYLESDKSVAVVSKLLIHDDERVRMAAGVYCIRAQILLDEGNRVLTAIKDHSASRYMRMSAKLNLQFSVPYE